MSEVVELISNSGDVEPLAPVHSIINNDVAAHALDLRQLDLALQDARFKLVYQKAKSMVLGKRLDIKQVTLMVPLLMQMAKDVKDTTGEQKRELVRLVLTHLSREMNFETDAQEELAKYFIEHELNDLIDTVYAASQGKFDTFKNKYSDDEVFDERKFDVLYRNLEDLIKGQSFGIKTLVVLVPAAMSSVAKFTQLSGHQRRLLVIRLFERLADNYKPTNESEDLVRLFIRDQVSIIIDMVYNAAKSKYIFKKVMGHLAKVCGWLKSKLHCTCCGASP